MDPFMAQLLLWPMGWAPSYWAQCDGRSMNVAQNSALFSLLGIAFGGNGSSTFNLPDFRGRVPMGLGTRPGTSINYNLANIGGTESMALTTANLPSHTHTAAVTTTPISVTIKASPAAGTDNVPGTNGSTTLAASMAGRATGSTIYNNQTPTVAMNTATDVSGGATTVVNSTVGNGAAFDNRMPYLAVNFIIALNGIYPTRD
ncbi:phage tail protein [Williamwhitmania taraxaci]|uniref:Microcystin-dependent protein n=1 Tax=Williamwhitmania taraxaci TaxID=1640674 RepID=A0A1G6L1B1_9BACT|nr:tail fiber protein [Williamwhitmania taraxaci]SDC37159.1 Microcystin-dependent protein [Williamwhitmania taraxaci]